VNTEKVLKIFFFSIFFGFVFLLFSPEVRDSDFWWHLKTGEYIYQTGSIPQTDPFAYTSLTKDPVNPESKRIAFILRQYWLAQLIFYWIYELFSFQGIMYLRAILLTSLVFLLYRSVRREGHGLFLSIFLLLPTVIILSSNYTGERPQLFSFLFAYLLIFLLESFRQKTVSSADRSQVQQSLGRRYLLPIPAIILLWANLHGGFFVGIILVLGYLFCETVKHYIKRFGKQLSARSLRFLAFTGFLSVLVSFVNPNGYNVISILFELEKSRYRETILEAMTPFATGLAYPHVLFFVILLIVSLFTLLINIKKLDLTDVMIFCGFAIMGLSAVRFIPFFAPVATLMIARYGSEIIDKLARRQSFMAIQHHIKIIFACFLLAVIVFTTVKFDLFMRKGVRPDKYPEGAVQFLKANTIPGNMYNPYYWGGYLIWSLYPDYKVFIDGRGLIEDVYFQYLNAFEAKSRSFEGIPQWKAVLNAYKVNFIVTFSVDRFTGRMVPLIPALYNDPEWHLIYMDRISLIFLRDRPENRLIIDRFGVPKEWLWGEVVTEALLKVKDSPKKTNFYITIGDAFLAKKSYADARAAYFRVMETEPNNSIVQERLRFLEGYGN